MTKLKLTLLMLFSITQLFAQKTEVVYLEENDTTRNFYTLIHNGSLRSDFRRLLYPPSSRCADR